MGGRQDKATGQVRVDHHHVVHHHQDPKQILVTYTEEFVATDTRTDNDEELTAVNTFATNGKKFDATTALADTKSHVNVELTETNKSKIKTTEGTKAVGPIRTWQTAVSRIVVNTWTYNIEYKSPSQFKKIEETNSEVFASTQVEEEQSYIRLHHHRRQQETGTVNEESAPPPSPPTRPS